MAKRLYVPGDICAGSGKLCYKSPQEVHWADGKMKARRRSRKDGQAYNCQHCGLWHLAHASRREAG